MLMQVWWKFHSAIVGFSMKVITVKFIARHDSCTVVARVKFCSDMVPNYGVTQKTNIFPRIWITTENPREMGPWFNIGSGNGLFPDFPKQLPEQLLTDYSVVGILAFTGVMDDHNVHIINKFVFGNTDLEFLFFSKTLSQSCRKI